MKQRQKQILGRFFHRPTCKIPCKMRRFSFRSFDLKKKDFVLFRNYFEKPAAPVSVPAVVVEREKSVQPYKSMIKERTLEKHLVLKSTLRSKSPRPGTALSRSTHSLGVELNQFVQHTPLQVKFSLKFRFFSLRSF